MWALIFAAWDWLAGIGLPFFAGCALLAGAAYVWFRVPVFGHYGGLALAVIGVAMIARASGYASARADCKDATLRTELAQARADLRNAQNAALQAREIGDRLSQSEAKNMELAHELAQRPVIDDCRADDGDVERLRAIR
jgi:hypothetical protein